MLTTDMVKKHKSVIPIENISSKAMKEALDCIYTGKFELVEETLSEVLNAAAFMQLINMLKACKKFMSKNLCESNCCLILHLAERYSFSEIIKEVNQSFLSKFDDVCKEPEFLLLSCKKNQTDFVIK